MANRLNSLEDFASFLKLSESEQVALKTQNLFRVDITPYFASLIDPHDPECPIRVQVIPNAKEIDKAS
jgi:lysine 2,3-aminomutase